MLKVNPGVNNPCGFTNTISITHPIYIPGNQPGFGDGKTGAQGDNSIGFDCFNGWITLQAGNFFCGKTSHETTGLAKKSFFDRGGPDAVPLKNVFAHLRYVLS